MSPRLKTQQCFGGITRDFTGQFDDNYGRLFQADGGSVGLAFRIGPCGCGLGCGHRANAIPPAFLVYEVATRVLPSRG